MDSNLPAGVVRETGPNGLVRWRVDTARCRALWYEHGAHLCEWQPKAAAQPVLWMSAKSLLTADKPIRGGVPVCFPWFGGKWDNPQAPFHGVARISTWKMDQVTARADGAIEAVLTWEPTAALRALYPYDFFARLTYTLGDTLGMSLLVRNTGSQPMPFEEALHTYLAVGDVRQVEVTGLTGATYTDMKDRDQLKTQGPEPITITAETDRLYHNTTTTCVLHDPAWRRRLVIEKQNSLVTVVWNPWVAKSKAMPDFGDDEWPGMICIETVNARDHKVTLGPGQSHTMSAIIRLEAL